MVSSNDIKSIQKCRIFKKKCQEGIKSLLKRINMDICWYSKDEIIATEGDSADYLGIVLEGSVEIKKIFPSGKSISLARLSEGETFGEGVLFSSENIYPATIIVPVKAKVMFISKNELEKLIVLDKHIAITFIETLSNRLLLLNKKIQVMSLDTLRKKIAVYLLDESKRQGSESLKLTFSRETWAQHLGVARPSLSRELARMQEAELISLENKLLVIKNIDALEDEIIKS